MAKVDMLESGIYSVSEASRLLRTSQQKVRGWIAGYPRRGEPDSNKRTWMAER